MQLYETVNGEVKVRLLRDHQPNQAMLNEFQTAQFDCKMTKMELCGSRLHASITAVISALPAFPFLLFLA